MREFAVVALVGCTSAAPTSPSASSSSPAPSSPSSAAAASSSAAAASSASSSSSLPPAAPASPFAHAFDPNVGRPIAVYEGEPWATGRPTTKRPSGAIFNLPAVFASVTSAFGAGMDAWFGQGPDSKAMISLSVARTKDALTDDKVGGVCGELIFKADAWKRVPGAGPIESAWKAKGKGMQNADWEAYAIDAVLPEFRVRGCGAWAVSRPEMEMQIVDALLSLRIGTAPPNDVNGL